MPSSQVACTCIQILWGIGGLVWFFRRNDELPLLISGFLYYVGSFRLLALTQGWAYPVDISGFGFEAFDYDAGAEALRLIVLGESTFLVGYLWFQKSNLLVEAFSTNESFMSWLKPKTFLLATVVIPISFVCRYLTAAAIQSNKSLAFEVSNYLYLFPLVLISSIVLLLFLWKAGAFETFAEKCCAGLLVGLSALFSYSAFSRFQFLGWVVSGSVIVSSTYSAVRRGPVVFGGFFFGVVMFAAAGALRSTFIGEFPEERNTAFQRFASAEDANMLDGFVLLKQVYPEKLPFGYGREHLDIILRVIPRAWWPEKPVGGYINKLGLVTADTGFTLGISPTLFGSFYSEGGVVIMAIIAFIYGAAFGKLIAASSRWSTFAGILVRSMLCAWIIPLLRGGDLPGIFAWFGMAFWPCLLICFMKRRILFSR